MLVRIEMSRNEIVTLRGALTQAVSYHRDNCGRCDVVSPWTDNEMQLCGECREYVRLDRRLREAQHSLMQDAVL